MELHQLKRAVLRGGVAKMVSQATNVLVRLGALMVFARLLSPTDFGLIGMVVAVTAVLGLLKDFGLSAATVQSATVTDDQMSSLFWLNTALGALIWLLCMVAAPIIVWFYGEPRLFWITIVTTGGFFFMAASVQHNALLQRRMQFGVLSLVEIIALLTSTGVGVAMAFLGMGYWALVGWSVALPVATCIGVWIASGWIPRLPKRETSVKPLLRFGILVTVNIIIVQTAYNLDKVLLGRFWGAEILGFYGRASQLTTMSSDLLMGAIGSVAFPALSRTQADVANFENFLLKGCKLTLTMAFPITVACILFADDIVFVLLGPKWGQVAPVLKLLSPLIMISAIISPSGWLLYSTGQVRRSLMISLVILPVVALGCIAGLRFGATGVAAGYAIAMALWVYPHLVWSTHGSTLTAGKLLRAAKIPMLASVTAAVAGYGAQVALSGFAPLARLFVGVVILLLFYALVVLWSKDERKFYLSLFRSLRAAGSNRDTARQGTE
jgi:O-antigen/teichoic acid export membrane protein